MNLRTSCPDYNKYYEDLFLADFLRQISLCNNHGYPETHFVNQLSLKLTEIGLPLPPKC